MTSKLLYTAETWDTVYKAFQEVNFTAYDYGSVKQSLLDNLKLNYPENFNDYIESSQLVALIEAFAYAAEQIAYRVDMSTHENTMTTAKRKQMILRQAKFLTYTASRNLPLRGLVKVVSISCSEDVTDSQGNNLSNKAVRWADAVNPLWREQFQAVVGRVLTRPLGAPLKVARVNDVVFQQHEARNLLESEADGTSFINGTIPYTIDVNGKTLPFELVPADVDTDGVFERSPDPNSHFNLLYADDGYGETSPMTGFMLYTKQGQLNKLRYVFDYRLPNRVIDVDVANVNDVDVWLQEVTEGGVLVSEWQQIDNINGENLFFNTKDRLKKYEVETRENDKIRMLFGDGDFSEIPTGIFNIWVRSSTGGDLVVPKDSISSKTFTFAYTSAQGRRESCTLTVSLTSALQNGAASEDIEHIRVAAPATRATQDRMVNGQDYNTYPMKESSILHLKTVNRTFAGQPKFVEWNDASGQYQTVKLFGDDGRLYYDIGSNVVTTKTSARGLVDEVIEPLLGTPGVYNLLTYSFYASGAPLNKAYVRPRVKLIESLTELIFEKTMIQGVLDRHWYGEPDSLVYLGPDLTTSSSPKSYYAVVNDDVDQRIYDANKKMVVKTGGSYTLVGTPGNVSGIQDGVMRQRRFGLRFNPDRAFSSDLCIYDGSTVTPGPTDSITTAMLGSAAVAESVTIEIINDSGEFTVTGTVTGAHPPGVIGEVYDSDYFNFLLAFKSGATDTDYEPGDAFIVDVVPVSSVMTPTLAGKRNLQGQFTLINELLLPADAEIMPYDVSDEVASWVIIIERVDDSSGQLDFWRVTSRNLQLVLGSPTTRFFFDKNSNIVDMETKQRVRDNVKVLKSNLDSYGAVLGKDQKFFSVDMVRHNDGTVNQYGLLVSPDTDNVEADSVERAASAYSFLKLIGSGNYVYFRKDPTTGRLTMIDPTAYITSLSYVSDASGEYVRKLGRAPLDFSWTHYVGGDNVTDPTPSNIHDMYVLTRGHYTAMNNWLKGLGPKPVPPSPFELRTSYRALMQKKMMSDSVVLHPAKVKPLFGSKAVPELRAKLKLVKANDSRLTDDQLRTRVLSLVDAYFNIEDWGFGKTFYAVELMAVIQSKLAIDLASVVLVPELPSSSFGDMLQVTAADDEVLMSALELKDVVVIAELNRTQLRQR